MSAAHIALNTSRVYCAACSEKRRGAGIVLEPGEGGCAESCDGCGQPLGPPLREWRASDLSLISKGIGSRTERRTVKP